MTWEYALIGLVLGIIIGVVALRFGTPKIRQQLTDHYKIEKSKAKLDSYHKEMANHLTHSVKLLDKMGENYRQFYQNIAKSSNSRQTEQHTENNELRYRLTEAEADNDQIPVEMRRPQNSSESTKSL
ncbi:MAG: ZapG family protein [Sodalis sp. (in: enterobacteria)]